MTAPSIVLTDLDGTLLTSEKTVHPLCLEALALLDERSIPFVISTGRPLSGVREDLLSLPGVHQVMCANGAYVVELDDVCRPETARVLKAWPMGPERCVELYDLVRDLDITFDVMADGRAYSEAARIARLPTFGLEPHFMAQIMASRTVVDMTMDRLMPTLGRVDRVSVYFHDQDQRRRVIEAADSIEGLHWTSSESGNVEISDVAASKGNALGWLCDHLGVDRSRSVAFGDGMNDTSMLEVAGVGVAMANAQEGVAAHADDETRLTNEEGGEGDYLLRALGVRP